MRRRILLCGLSVGAFILTLAFSSWHDGLWRLSAAPATSDAPRHLEDGRVATGARASQEPVSEAVTTPGTVVPAAAAPVAAAPVAAAPVAAAMPPPLIMAAPEPPSPNADDGAAVARTGRGTERDARSR